MQVRKKPIILQAWEMVEDFENVDKPDWVLEALENGTITFEDDHWVCNSLEGQEVGKINDILMKGVRGELYICDQDIFKETYDIVKD